MMKFSYSHLLLLAILLLSSQIQCLASYRFPSAKQVSDFAEAFADVAAAADNIVDWMIPTTISNDGETYKYKTSSNPDTTTKNVLCQYVYPNNNEIYSWVVNPQVTCDRCYKRDIFTGACDESQLLCNFASDKGVITFTATNGSCGVLCYRDGYGKNCYYKLLPFRRLEKQPVQRFTPPTVTIQPSTPPKSGSWRLNKFLDHVVAFVLIVITVIVG